jgi:hypothetical protein
MGGFFSKNNDSGNNDSGNNDSEKKEYCINVWGRVKMLLLNACLWIYVMSSSSVSVRI